MIAAALNLADDLGNVTGAVGQGIQSFAGNWSMLVGAAVLIIAAVIVIYVLKNLIANAIAGIVALLVIVYIFGVNIPLNALTILVSVLGGLGGVGALLIATFFGWI